MTKPHTKNTGHICFLFLAAAILASGCVQGSVDYGDAAYRLNATYAQQFDELVSRWNELAGMKLAVTKEGMEVYFDSRLSAANVSCADKMAPTFGCGDIVLELPPASEGELKAGDVVSFEITGEEARAFGEEPFAGTKTIQRRIFRVGQDSQGAFYIMKRDAADTTHVPHVRFGSIKGKAAGFIFDAELESTGIEPYVSESRSLQDYNELVDKWNNFTASVYEAGIQGGYRLYYSRRAEVPRLACTGSMMPAMNCNDLALVVKPAAAAELKQGDVISFRIAPNETSGFLEPPSNETAYIMHRIFRITATQQGSTAFITKGDNPETNAQTDAIWLDFGRVEGKLAALFKESFGETFGLTS